MTDATASAAAEQPAVGTQAEIDALRTRVAELTGRSRRMSAGRLLAFAAALVLIISGWGGAAGTALAIALLLSFPFLVVLHQRLDDARRAHEVDIALLVEERARRNGERTARGAPAVDAEAPPLARGERPGEAGGEFALDAGAADDLDLLRGRDGLFGLLSTCSTPVGRARLRHLLLYPLLDADHIARRQTAVRELAERDGERRALLRALLPLRDLPLDDLPRELRAPRGFARRRGLEWTVRLLGTVTPLLFLASFAWVPGLSMGIVLLLVNAGFISTLAARSNPARDHLTRLAPLCRAILGLDGCLTGWTPSSAPWRDLRADLARAEPVARKLQRAVRGLDLHRHGPVFELFNAILLWELRVLPAAERTVEKHRDELERGLGALAHAEALLSLSCLLAERPGFTLPEALPDRAPVIEAEELAHPLLPTGERVANPLGLGGERRIAVITGSNMAGKSTYLKAVGVNLALACAGAPVCARSFRFTPLRLFTDVNVRDSLDDGKSYFQVEVERVRAIVNQSRQSAGVIAILDELFRGTNAAERFAIGRALLDELAQCGVLVVLATHDDRLAREVEEERSGGKANWHFREHVVDGELCFDYRLCEGRARTRNAIAVLETAGYPEGVVRAARRYARPDEGEAARAAGPGET